MCGIVGIFDTRGRAAVDRALLGRMNDSLRHRGPDGDGIFVDPGVGLGHRRLSIIDLSGGAQPLFNEDHSVVVVFNGEIYNFPKLTRELMALGHSFRTHCDTEVIVHAWEEWGERCVERFRGMFAFAIWDRGKETLFLARDRLGIKPFYYAVRSDGILLFGSELKALLLDPQMRREIDPSAVEEYFAYGYVPDPKTIYDGIRKLAPGHVLSWRRGASSPAPRQYWDVAFTGDHRGSEEDICAELIEKLGDAVECRMIADVPLGAFLSGGVDSSAVVAMMAQHSTGSVNTCAISFGDPAYDEANFAAQVAERYHTNHRVSRVDPDVFDLLDRLALLYDEPYADSSAMPTYRVCELARRHVTVALSGDGGDEVFAGYRRYRWYDFEQRFRNTLPASLRGPLFGLAGRLYPKMDWAPRVFRAKATLEAIARDPVEGYFHGVSILNDRIRESVFSPSLKRQLQGYHAREVLKRHMEAAQTDHYLSRIQYADLKTYLAGDILTKVDRASMAHSLEVRVPLLDHPFLEWSARLPAGVKLRGGEGKYIFKKALRSRLPDDILYRPKMGFAVPLASWFRGPLRDRVRTALTGPALAETGMFDMRCLARLVDDHQSGLSDHSPVLWSLLMFESFLRQVHKAGPMVHAVAPPRAAVQGQR